MSTFQLAMLLLVASFVVPGVVNAKSVFGTGTRIYGDRLLVKDVLHSPKAALEESSAVDFYYAVPEPITYFEISAEQNVLAEVSFSYHDDIVKGTITAINTSDTGVHQSFEVVVTIFGFTDTQLSVDPAFILNRHQHIEGVLEPLYLDEDDVETEEDYDDVADTTLFKLNQKALETFDELHADSDGNAGEDYDGDDREDREAEYGKQNERDDGSHWIGGVGGDDDEENIDDDDDFRHVDRIIELGHRQQGDYLIYETYEVSALSILEPPLQAAVFYYVDSNFITHARFIVFDHNVTEQEAPQVEYTHYSPHTLKATIVAKNGTTLFVQMLLFGYKPEDVPREYMPFLSSRRAGDPTDSPLSPLHQLRQLMQAQRVKEISSIVSSDSELAASTNDTVYNQLQLVNSSDNGISLKPVYSLFSTLLLSVVGGRLIP